MTQSLACCCFKHTLTAMQLHCKILTLLHCHTNHPWDQHLCHIMQCNVEYAIRQLRPKYENLVSICDILFWIEYFHKIHNISMQALREDFISNIYLSNVFKSYHKHSNDGIPSVSRLFSLHKCLLLSKAWMPTLEKILEEFSYPYTWNLQDI